MMVPASVGVSLFLFASVCFPVVDPLDVYEESVYIPKEKPVRRYPNSWYTQPTPRLGKRRPDEDNEIYHDMRCQPFYSKLKDYPDFEIKDRGGDSKDSTYKITPRTLQGRDTY